MELTPFAHVGKKRVSNKELLKRLSKTNPKILPHVPNIETEKWLEIKGGKGRIGEGDNVGGSNMQFSRLGSQLCVVDP